MNFFNLILFLIISFFIVAPLSAVFPGAIGNVVLVQAGVATLRLEAALVAASTSSVVVIAERRTLGLS